jgi:hypothetical protein
LVLITSACALLLVCFQAGRRAPALPSAFSTIVLVLAIPTDLWLVIRVLISPPAHVQAGAYVGLVAGLGLLAGAYLSLRQEGILPADGPQTIPTVPLGERTRS